MRAANAAGALRRVREGISARRTIVGAAAGGATLTLALALDAPWMTALLSAWDATAGIFVVWVWLTIAPLDATATCSSAGSEDGPPTRRDALLLGASIASLVAVVFMLAQTGRSDPGSRTAYTALAVASVVLSWTTVHTIFALHYARLYYSAPVGGLSFHEDDPPNYSDFAYVALTIGMTFQVSDTDISKRKIRRAAIQHALLSYLFGSVIVAITVSTIATLLNG
jgi:uncharacterized membrane protein